MKSGWLGRRDATAPGLGLDRISRMPPTMVPSGTRPGTGDVDGPLRARAWPSASAPSPRPCGGTARGGLRPHTRISCRALASSRIAPAVKSKSTIRRSRMASRLSRRSSEVWAAWMTSLRTSSSWRRRCASSVRAPSSASRRARDSAMRLNERPRSPTSSEPSAGMQPEVPLRQLGSRRLKPAHPPARAARHHDDREHQHDRSGAAVSQGGLRENPDRRLDLGERREHANRPPVRADHFADEQPVATTGQIDDLRVAGRSSQDLAELARPPPPLGQSFGGSRRPEDGAAAVHEEARARASGQRAGQGRCEVRHREIDDHYAPEFLPIVVDRQDQTQDGDPERFRLLDGGEDARVGREGLGPLEERRVRVARGAWLDAMRGRAHQHLPRFVEIARLGHDLVAAAQELGEVVRQLLEGDVRFLHESVLELGLVVAQRRRAGQVRDRAPARGGTVSAGGPPGAAALELLADLTSRSPSCWSTDVPAPEGQQDEGITTMYL